MTNQNFSTISNFPNSNFPKVIAFLQPPYDHNKNSLKVKEDLSKFCQKNNFNLLEAIDFKDPCDYKVLHKLVNLVDANTSDNAPTPIKIMINEEMVATPINIPFWHVLGTLVDMKRITVAAYDYDCGSIFLDDSYLSQFDFFKIASSYFKNHYILYQKRQISTSKNRFIGQLTPKPILFLLGPYTPENRELRKEIATYCKNNSLGILKTIRPIDSLDAVSFRNLVREVAKLKNKPVMIIIDESKLHDLDNMIFWVILGTLRTAELIKVSTYTRVNGVITLNHLNKHKINKPKNNFIYEATIQARKLKRKIRALISKVES